MKPETWSSVVVRDRMEEAGKWIWCHGNVVLVVCVLASLFLVLLLAVCEMGVPDVADMDAACESCLKEKRFSEAAIWARRSLREEPDRKESRMNLIKSQIGLGAWGPMAEQLNWIAPMDRPVYGPAHLLRAQLLWAGQTGGEPSRPAVERCLELAWKAGLSTSPEGLDKNAAHALGVRLAASRGDWKLALQEVGEIAEPDCDLNSIKALACWNLGMDEQALSAADEALEAARRLVEGEDASVARRRLSVVVLASVSKGDLNFAIDALVKSGLDSGSAPEARMLKELAKIIAGACRSGHHRNSDTWLEAMAFGLRSFPEDLELTLMLIDGVADWHSLPGFMERLKDRFAIAGLVGFRDLIQGMELLSGASPDTAIGCFEEAYTKLPLNPVVGNNYAALLGTRPVSPQTGKARGIMAGILRTHPGDPAFLDTMGRIELRCGNNSEAIRFFEHALRQRPDSGTRIALAEAYARSGNEAKATELRKAAGIAD